jgi:hypothetical protein
MSLCGCTSDFLFFIFFNSKKCFSCSWTNGRRIGASFPASENVLCGGGGESEALQLAIRQPEELAVASPGSESDCSHQSGFGSHEARKAIELEKKGSVVEEGSSLVCRKLLEVW